MVTEGNSIVNNSKRIDWIDFAKGLALILVVIGHSVSGYETGSITRGVIFSFHMPIFFILSCATYRWSTTLQEYLKKLAKAARHLLIPAAATYIILIIVDIIRQPSLFISGDFWHGKLYTFVFTSGVQTNFGVITVNAIGMTWFFLVLFAARAIFDYMHLYLSEQLLLIVSIVCGILGIVVGSIYWLPFSLDIALAVMPFMYFGYKIKTFNPEKHPWVKLLICLAIWVFVIYLTFPDWRDWTYLELAIRRYPLFPLCYIGAICGSMFICEIGVLFCKLGKIAKPLVLFGRYSLYFFCIHILDEIWKDLYTIENHQFLSAGKRLLLDLIAFGIFMVLRFAFKKALAAIRQRKA